MQEAEPQLQGCDTSCLLSEVTFVPRLWLTAPDTSPGSSVSISWALLSARGVTMDFSGWQLSLELVTSPSAHPAPVLGEKRGPCFPQTTPGENFQRTWSSGILLPFQQEFLAFPCPKHNSSTKRWTLQSRCLLGILHLFNQTQISTQKGFDAARSG